MLSIRSPLFKGMLTAEIKDKATNTIECPTLDHEVCEEMLSYIHTDDTPHISTMAEALWHAAHCYQLPNLQARCEEVLADQITIENAAHFLAFADQYCEKSCLREYIISFATQDNLIHATKLWPLKIGILLRLRRS